MIKILFEVSEDFIRENVSPKTYVNKINKRGADPLKALVDMMSFNLLEELINEGKTEFVVTPDKLDDKSNRIYDETIGTVCVLASFSERDNKKKSLTSNPFEYVRSEE